MASGTFKHHKHTYTIWAKQKLFFLWHVLRQCPEQQGILLGHHLNRKQMLLWSHKNTTHALLFCCVHVQNNKDVLPDLNQWHQQCQEWRQGLQARTPMSSKRHNNQGRHRTPTTRSLFLLCQQVHVHSPLQLYSLWPARILEGRSVTQRNFQCSRHWKKYIHSTYWSLLHFFVLAHNRSCRHALRKNVHAKERMSSQSGTWELSCPIIDLLTALNYNLWPDWESSLSLDAAPWK